MLLGSDKTQLLHGRLAHANAELGAVWIGEPLGRQPVHVVYGGAHLFKAETPAKLGALARQSLAAHAGDVASFATAFGFPRQDERAVRIAALVQERVGLKLAREPVEDLRIDFEDGFGYRTDAEEDGYAEQAARELAKAHAAGTLPPFIGLRIKAFSNEAKQRALRTLDAFFTALLTATGGTLPDPFLVTLPKVAHPDHVAVLADALALIEQRARLAAKSLRIEIMVETTQALFGRDGALLLPRLVAAGDGRVFAAHFGAYDYTAACGIAAAAQALDHEACDFARHVMKVALAGMPVFLSDGATNVMPIGNDRAVVHRAWQLMTSHVRRSLRQGFYQGWDLHPAQLPARYASVYGFFLENLEATTTRLAAFMGKAAQANLVGDVFDDAATGQGLVNFFLRGLACGALTEAEAEATGLSLAELRTRSFQQILQGRRAKP